MLIIRFLMNMISIFMLLLAVIFSFATHAQAKPNCQLAYGQEVVGENASGREFYSIQMSDGPQVLVSSEAMEIPSFSQQEAFSVLAKSTVVYPIEFRFNRISSNSLLAIPGSIIVDVSQSALRSNFWSADEYAYAREAFELRIHMSEKPPEASGAEELVVAMAHEGVTFHRNPDLSRSETRRYLPLFGEIFNRENIESNDSIVYWISNSGWAEERSDIIRINEIREGGENINSWIRSPEVSYNHIDDTIMLRPEALTLELVNNNMQPLYTTNNLIHHLNAALSVAESELIRAGQGARDRECLLTRYRSRDMLRLDRQLFDED